MKDITNILNTEREQNAAAQDTMEKRINELETELEKT